VVPAQLTIDLGKMMLHVFIAAALLFIYNLL
jgi:hypothetical protein